MKFDMNTFLSIAALTLVQASEEASEETRNLRDGGYDYYSDYSGPYDPRYAPHGYDSGYASQNDPYGYKNSRYDSYGDAYYKKTGKKGKGKGKDERGRGTNGKPLKEYQRAKYGMEQSKKNGNKNECDLAHCDFFFDAVNKQSDGYGSYFTREDCKWDPTPVMDFYMHGSYRAAYPPTQCPDWPTMDCDKLEACKCYWKLEAQCKSNLLPEFQHPQVPHYKGELEKALQAFSLIQNDNLYAKKVAPKLEECFSDEVYACLCNPELNAFLSAESAAIGDNCPSLEIDGTTIHSDSITIEDDASCLISDISVEINIDHTFVGDLVITLTHEETGKSVNMWDGECGDTVNLSALFIDGGGEVTCVEINEPSAVPVDPTASGRGPAFSTFSGESTAGTWRLDVRDTFSSEDDGVLNFWILNVVCACGSSASAPSLCATSQTGAERTFRPEDLQNSARLGDPSPLRPSPEE